jgi:hypothetical protein
VAEGLYEEGLAIEVVVLHKPRDLILEGLARGVPEVAGQRKSTDRRAVEDTTLLPATP